MRLLAATAIVATFLGGCGGEGATDATAASSALTSLEREWCSLPDDSAETALRWELIELAGSEAGVRMDLVSIFATELREFYEDEQGLDAGAAVAAVSDALVEHDRFITACKAAYATYGEDAQG